MLYACTLQVKMCTFTAIVSEEYVYKQGKDKQNCIILQVATTDGD